MKFTILLCLLALSALAAAPGNAAPGKAAPDAKPEATPDFAAFERRAQAGESLNVVFFGASLTWGANASDPLLTSYRANVAQRLEAAYPRAHFHFWDAAIGGTGSQLGVFRLERDVLARRPDLVFLDFSANDDITSDNPETLASYEAIVRRLIAEAHAPVVQMIFPFKWNVVDGDLAKMKRRTAHLAIAQAYHTAVGDAIALAIERVKMGATTLERLWPLDGVHPCDEGYVLFADAAWSAFQDAVQRKVVCRVPEKMLYGDAYLRSARVRISSLGALPPGWKVGLVNRTSAYFDFLMSRWLDDEAIASNRAEVMGADGKKQKVAQEPARLSLKFRGGMVLLFGEGTPKSGKYRVLIDGAVVSHKPGGAPAPLTEYDAGELARRSGGNVHHVNVVATGLDPTREHTLEIEPVFDAASEQELRLESVCVAGGEARVEAAAH